MPDDYPNGAVQCRLRMGARLTLSDMDSTGRYLAYILAKAGITWRKEAAANMPEATGDIREIVGQPVFVPLYNLFKAYGGVFRLSFGPKSFVVVSDPAVARQVSTERLPRPPDASSHHWDRLPAEPSCDDPPL